LNWVWWFNETRLHGSLGYKPPIEFENDYYRHNNPYPSRCRDNRRFARPGALHRSNHRQAPPPPLDDREAIVKESQDPPSRSPRRAGRQFETSTERPGSSSGGEELIDRGRSAVHRLEEDLVPAWRRVTEGETRWPVSLVVVAAIALQVGLPHHLSIQPFWVLPALESVLLVGLVIANPTRISRTSSRLRSASLGLIAVISLANAWSAGRLITALLDGQASNDARQLLGTGGAIWITNVIVFALWYWELDQGGPGARANHERRFVDFKFPQMDTPELAPKAWEPKFWDYFYTSFTNATAFSPTDVMPLSRWAKMMMLVQSAVSLATVALVIARAVNVLK